VLVLAFFIIIASLISYIDSKKEIIPDKIIIPAFFVLVLLKYVEGSLLGSDFIAVGIVFVIFVIPIVLNMAFGGGDLRFGAFCALFLGLKPIGFFILFSGLAHLVITFVLKKKSFAFAPAMSIGAILAYFMGSVNL